MRLQFTDNFTSKGLQHSQHHHLEPIAVVGFSLRFPQEATSAENFWQMLVDKGCAMTEWPKDRANTEAFYHPDADRTNTNPLMGAHFLQEGLAVFDAPFFSTTSAEASSMDLQQRGLFELHTERWRTLVYLWSKYLAPGQGCAPGLSPTIIGQCWRRTWKPSLDMQLQVEQ